MGLRLTVKQVFAVAVLVCIFAPSATLAQNTQVSQAERAEAIDTLLKNLESDYILPDVAKKIVQAIRDHQARHEYDAIIDGDKLAKALTNDLQAVSHDHHLGVDYSAQPMPEGNMDQPSPEDIRKFRLAGERRNFSYRRSRSCRGESDCCRWTDFVLRSTCAR